MTTNIAPEQAARNFAKKALSEGFMWEALHAYKNPDGTDSHWRIRLKHKDDRKWMRPMYQDESGKFHLCEPPHLKGRLKPLYNLHLLAQKSGAVVFIMEGEKKCDVANQFFSKHGVGDKYIATTSGSATSANGADWTAVAEKPCRVLPDNNEAGFMYGKNAAEKLHTLGCTVETIDSAALGLPDGGDFVDWLHAHPDAMPDDLMALPRLQQPSEGQTQADMQATVKRLAALPPMEYDRVRKEEARKLGCRTETLDAEVYKERPTGSEGNGMDSMFPTVEPWPDPVNGAILLDEIYETIKRFIVCSKETAQAVALWIVFTWFIDVVQISPIAIITAPEKRCGKSQLLIVISRLVRRPLVASNISPAAIFRVVEGHNPTLLIDEADTFLRDNEEARGILNSGHTRQAAYVIRTVGDNHEPQKFSTWSAKVISGIGSQADTIMDRAVILELRRKLPGESVERLRHADKRVFLRLVSMLARYAQDASAEIERARPVLPDELNDRAQDNWESLLAIADHAEGAWPKMAREAALILSGVEQEAASLSTELLADIQEVFTGKYKISDRISSANLLQELNADDSRLWATYGKGGKPMTARQQA